MDVRVEDYLNDKFQTEADLENLNALLETAQQQQTLLKRQLDEANALLREVGDVSADHEASLHEDVTGFSSRQTEIDSRLRELTSSGTTDEAVASFEGTLATLRRLDIASSYIELLQEVDELGTAARQNLRSSPRSALPNYSRLRSLVEALKQAQPAAEGAAPHLIDHVEQQTTQLWEQMRTTFGDDLQKTLERMSWPQKRLKLDQPLLAQWQDQVELLLDLQEPDLRIRTVKAQPGAQTDDPAVLLPLEVMVHPLELRFRYHFYGDRPTNRLDKPEFFLSHIIDLVEDQKDFLLDHFQPILDRRTADVDIDVSLAYTDAIIAFITALLPMVRHKCLNVLPQISDNAQLMSHLIHELMGFDTTLRDTWGYSPTVSLNDNWKGLTWEMLVPHGYFNIWLDGEKSFALNRYQGIILAADSGEIDYDTPLPDTTKPTKGAIRVNDLLETITDRYRPLSSFSQKLRFLIDIQLEIFDQYHRRLHESLEAYLTMTSTIGRTMTASAGRESGADVSGVKGLDRLCRVFGSAEYLEKKMLDWGDDVFFLELWDELQYRAKNGGADRSVAKDLSVSEIASKTSSSITNGTERIDNEAGDGALFDETASAYRRLRTRSEGIIVETLDTAVRGSLRPYSRTSTWSSLSDSSSTGISPELSGTVQLLDAYLHFLASVLAKAPLRRVTRQLCLGLQSYFWDYVLMRNSFSAEGAASFQTDVQAICNVIDQYVGLGVAENGMTRLHDALSLLCLPAAGISGDSSAITGRGDGEDAWGFDEDEPNGPEGRRDDGNQEASTDSDESPLDSTQAAQWGLWEAEKQIFRSNDSAREALRLLGLDALGEIEARGVLERRVELQQ